MLIPYLTDKLTFSKSINIFLCRLEIKLVDFRLREDLKFAYSFNYLLSITKIYSKNLLTLNEKFFKIIFLKKFHLVCDLPCLLLPSLLRLCIVSPCILYHQRNMHTCMHILCQVKI
jgi:hypothetical protein